MAMQNGQRSVWATGGVLFAVFFLGGGALSGIFSSGSLPLPGAPAADVVGYFSENQTATLVSGVGQILASISLFAFVSPVTDVLRRRVGGSLPGVASVGGVVSAALLLVCALLGLTLTLGASGLSLGVVNVMRDLNFLSGGTFHIAALGVFIGATSLAARGAKALPAWVCWLGIIVGAIAILSLLSLFVYYANALILFGRMLGFVWCVSAGMILLFGEKR